MEDLETVNKRVDAEDAARANRARANRAEKREREHRQAKEMRYERRGDCLALACEVYRGQGLTAASHSVLEMAQEFERWMMEPEEDCQAEAEDKLPPGAELIAETVLSERPIAGHRLPKGALRSS